MKKKRLKYFLDTEFIERPCSITLISIGIKCEDGREYYQISSEFDYDDANEWVKCNVISPMYNSYLNDKKYSNNNIYTRDIKKFNKIIGKKRYEIRDEVLDFVGHPQYRNNLPEFWGWYCAYDWVVFCWLFGEMSELPVEFQEYCKDLRFLLDLTKKEKIRNPEGQHNALVDAKWNEKLYNHIKGK